MYNQEIPIVRLKTQLPEGAHPYSKPVLENEISGVNIKHVVIKGGQTITDYSTAGYKTIYLFIKGTGNVTAEKVNYEVVPETIFLPNAIEEVTMKAADSDTLHYVKISCELTAQDRIELKNLPAENTQQVYYAKFSDCKSYVEPIKSPNTVSRTILSNKYIPRIAMGTVQTTGPDEVGAHEHPMLEQLFLGLSKNKCTVYADEAEVHFPQHSILHIPLGSRHSVSVEKAEILYYVWMDFFLDSKGEEWLKTHI